MKRFLGALLLAPLLAGSVFAPGGDSATRFASQPAFAREFWRLSGHVVTKSNRRFDFAMLFFRFRVARPEPRSESSSNWAAADIYPAAASIVDEENLAARSERRIERGALALAAASSQRLDVHVDEWRATGSGTANGFAMSLRGRIDGISLAVRGRSRKAGLQFPATDGIGNAPDCAVRESVLTSLQSTGTIEIDGVRLPVSGTSWLDHEYGDRFLCAGESGWDRFWVQLDDHREILIERKRSAKKPPVTSIAILVDTNGTRRVLASNTYALFNDGGAHWRSRHSGALYPSLWGLTIPSAGLMLSLEPVTNDQEVAANGVGASFWEGALDVYDVTPGTPGRRLGSGYAELTGYAERPSI